MIAKAVEAYHFARPDFILSIQTSDTDASAKEKSGIQSEVEHDIKYGLINTVKITSK